MDKDFISINPSTGSVSPADVDIAAQPNTKVGRSTDASVASEDGVQPLAVSQFGIPFIVGIDPSLYDNGNTPITATSLNTRINSFSFSGPNSCLSFGGECTFHASQGRITPNAWMLIRDDLVPSDKDLFCSVSNYYADPSVCRMGSKSKLDGYTLYYAFNMSDFYPVNGAETKTILFGFGTPGSMTIDQYIAVYSMYFKLV